MDPVIRPLLVDRRETSFDDVRLELSGSATFGLEYRRSQRVQPNGERLHGKIESKQNVIKQRLNTIRDAQIWIAKAC